MEIKLLMAQYESKTMQSVLEGTGSKQLDLFRLCLIEVLYKSSTNSNNNQNS